MFEFAMAIEGISAAETLSDLECLFPELCRALDLSHMVYHSLRAPSIEPKQPVLLYTYESDWVGRYFAERYNEIDPIILFGRRAFLPLDWSKIPREGSHVLDFFSDSERYGVGRHGVSIPIRGPHGERSLFTLNSTASFHTWERTRQRFMPQFHLLGHLIHERAMRLAHAREGSLPLLSQRERQCLHAAAAGKQHKAIAWELGLSERVVTEYLQSARHKLGASTLSQAVATALMMELIEL